jgi:ATP-binding cassette subfamily F protein 3
MSVLLRLEGVARSIGARTLFRDVDLAVAEGDRIGLVGPNGAGKTTLLRIAAGLDPPDAGRVEVPRRVRVALLRQEIDPQRAGTVREEAAGALSHLADLEGELREMEAEMERVGRAGDEVPADLAERYDRCRAAFEFAGGFAREARVDRVLAGLGFDAARASRPLASFSGGWLMRVELAKLLLAAPDVLLLDEPTNHLDLPSIEWFEETLAGFGGAVVMISHDRSFLRRHVSAVAELEGGRFSVYVGNYDRYLEQRAQRREELLARKRNQDRARAQTERFAERFRYKASKARQVQSRVKALERLERIEIAPESRKRIALRIPEPARAGEVVLELEAVHKRYGETRVYEGVDFHVRRGERVALLGPNGAGKSTLLRMAAGVLAPDSGTRRPGHNVTAAFYAQHQLEELVPGNSVLAELERAARSGDRPRLRDHLGAFLFSGDDVDKKVSVLSGGEKARLALARMLLRPANFLVMDEPTNHLDLAAREVLEVALSRYRGTLLFISHDREFIDALATRVVEVEAGRLHDHLGNYSDYRRRAAARAAAEGVGAGEAAPRPTASPSKQERMAARAKAKARSREIARLTRRVAALEQEAAKLEAHLGSLDERLADPEVYSDGDAVREVEAERAEMREALDARLREWEQAAAELEAAGRED